MSLEMDAPRAREPRWMNDNDIGTPLVLEAVNKMNDQQIELVFSTPLGESIRRTTTYSSSEYAYVYNSVQSGAKVFKYTKNKQGFRVPQTA